MSGGAWLVKTLSAPGVQVTLSHGFDSVVNQIRQGAAGKAYRVGNAIRTEAVKGMAEEHHGRVYRVPGTKKASYTASAPGEFPAIRTGRLRSSVKVATEVDVAAGKASAIVGTKLPYGLFLELGTKNMDPRPWLTLALMRAWPTVKRIIDQPLFTEAAPPEGES